jgi:hypothetical protein
VCLMGTAKPAENAGLCGSRGRIFMPGSLLQRSGFIVTDGCGA